MELPETSHGGELYGVRPEIALSWRRAQMSGLNPETAVDSLTETDFDPRSRLLVAASPVLEDLESKLGGTSYCILLADRQCRIIHRWFDDRRVERILDDVGARPGSTFLEETIGTNALGTAFELRKGIAVHGDEHFVEPFKQFSCYGQPIRHPLTKRVEGVLDITGLASAANPLLAPLIGRAVDDIEQRLLDGTRSSERHLLEAFQAESTRQQQALAAIGENVVLANKAALDLLQPGDYASMRMLMGGLCSEPGTNITLSLASGEAANIGARRVRGAGGGAIFRIDLNTKGSSARGAKGASVGVRSRLSNLPLLVSGPPGSGRTTTARDQASREPVVFLTSATALLEGEGTWAHEFDTYMRAGTGTLCVEGIDLLSDGLLSLLVEKVRRGRRPELIFTSGPREGLTGLARTLASMCIQHVDLLRLSERGQEMNELAKRAIHELNPGAKIRLTPSVLEALAAQAWPGNLHELRAVMAHVISGRTTGDVTLLDLPEAYRVAAPEKPLAGLERAERDAIVRALAQFDGNKVKAAKELGVSRTTLYARMRALRIASY